MIPEHTALAVLYGGQPRPIAWVMLGLGVAVFGRTGWRVGRAKRAV